MDMNYFVCTLGEAANLQDIDRPYRNINQLLNEQHIARPELPAVGFFTVARLENDTKITPRLLNFGQIQRGVNFTAQALSHVLDLSQRGDLALLCSSSHEFFFLWLACIRLQRPLLLIAPECAPSDIATLCSNNNIGWLLVDEKLHVLGTEAVTPSAEPRIIKHPLVGLTIDEIIEKGSHSIPFTIQRKPDDSDIAFLHHTSGTTSGVPKPIPQSHRGTVGALPALNGQAQATFTTTPLFHGAPADILRAWTSNALIWLFPSRDLPITAGNVMKCLDAAQELSDRGQCAPVKYFASVPYVLEMMAETDAGWSHFRRMDLVGVGGAALAEAIGDNLVAHGVRLVSRFGSAECGFLLSSHRIYEEDSEWMYLRVPPHVQNLILEPREDGLSELVVHSGWPHLAKQNRFDGSYATSDLFEPHPDLKDVWKYHSRSEGRIILSTGKKFDPAPIEASIVEKNELISSALVFGSGQSHPGALLFRKKGAAKMTDGEILGNVASLVESINLRSDTHARISPKMIVPMPYAPSPLCKSSKGTVLRSKTEKRYARAIESAYDEDEMLLSNLPTVHEIPNAVRRLISQTMQCKGPLEATTDLFAIGIDSIHAMQIRKGLQRLLPQKTNRLPLTIVEDCGTIERITGYLVSLSQGQDPTKALQIDIRTSMQQILDSYGSFPEFRTGRTNINDLNTSLAACAKVIVLTGATGALGATVLHKLVADSSVSRVICLVRADDKAKAFERLQKTLNDRQLQTLDQLDRTKVEAIPVNLANAKLGLSDSDYADIADQASSILHIAWSVNFRKKLSSFANEDVAGVRHLLDLALASRQTLPPTFLFCSSVASVMRYHEGKVPETIIDDADCVGDTGYSQSKWVAEQICARAARVTPLRNRITILRVGQLSSDSESGVWNIKEAWPLMLSTANLTGLLPDLQQTKLDWLPVDIAAVATVQAIDTQSADDTIHVFHVLNDLSEPTWHDLIRWLQKKISLQVVTPIRWLRELEALAETRCEHPALQLLPHWQSSLSNEEVREATRFNMGHSRRWLPALCNVKPINEEDFAHMWSWISEHVR